MDGMVVIDKPAGMTSHDVVTRCRRALGERRVGHAGTLDPSATGVLVVGVGRATRLLRFVETGEKEYRATAVFGITTTTLDADGEVTGRRDASALTEDAMAAVIPRFIGEVEQIPPMVSAIKIGGEALYRKARRGESVERPSRTVRIDEIVIESFDPGEEPRATLRIRCSRGTYVRSLVADIGEALEVGAHVAALRRLRVGDFTEEDAVSLDEIASERLKPMEDAVAGYPRRSVDADDARALIQGKVLPVAGIEGPYAVIGPHGLIAMAEDRGEETRSLCVLTTQG
jgi:tRNA pseudouridine55 synthase